MVLIRLLLWAACSYVAVVVIVYLAQRRLLHHPQRVSADDMLGRAAEAGLQPWPDDRGDCRAFVHEPDCPTPLGTAIVFHGNAGAAADRTYYVAALGRLGYRVLLAEYPGYGPRPGPLTEEALVADAVETVRLALECFGPPLYLWGESLGAGVAAAAAGRNPAPVAGVALITPWDTLPDLAQSLYWFLPARWLVKDRYDSIRNLRDFPGPVAVAVSGNDRIIPPRFARHLYESLAEPKRLWVFEGAGHLNWPAGPEEVWWAEVAEFLAAAAD